MVKIEDSKSEMKMERKITDKIQIYPSKPHISFTKMTNQMPKLTKTIMSPLTTMPPKIMVVQSNRQPFPSAPSNTFKSIQMRNLPTSKNDLMTLNNAGIKIETISFPEPPIVNKSKEKVVENKSSASSSNSLYKTGKILLDDVNPYITCHICKGYLIKATTIVECLHTFCHSCLMRHLAKEKQCPQCDMSINKSKTNIKYDATIQSIVYKLVPGLYQKELLRRRAFYKERPIEAKHASPEERGDDTEHLIFSPNDLISISLDYAEKEIFQGSEIKENIKNLSTPKFLNCPAVFKIEHLKKFIFNKYCINSSKFAVEISYKVKTIVLPEHYTLMDVAYIYTWKKETPMQFFYRIVKKSSKFDELPEVSLRRSPPTTATIDVCTNKTAKNCEILSIDKKISDGKKGVSNGNYEQHQPIKIKLSVSNKNVSIISNNAINQKRDEKLDNKNLNSAEKDDVKKNIMNTFNIKDQKKEDKKDEYEFEDDIDQQKLGFLNAFQLTAKKVLEKNKTEQNVKSDKPISPKKTLSFVPSKQRDSKEALKTCSKKMKFNEGKEDDRKYVFTKTSTVGHEIAFDMSPKPLGTKPTLKEVKNDIMMVKRATDAKICKQIEPRDVATINEKSQKETSHIKPKKLPMLLPKNPTTVFSLANSSPNITNSLSTSTSLAMSKPNIKKDFPSKEISLTKINPNQNHRVYGPKSPMKIPSHQSQNVVNEFKKSEGFLQPLPPKPKSNALPIPSPTNILKPYGSPMKLPKNIPENMQTPYGCRTPFYVPSSPSYTPNFDAKPQFKYANPNAYASFMQTMFSPATSEKNASNSEISKKRPAPSEISTVVPNKKKSLSPGTSVDSDSKSMCILNKINFPSSLSVTLTNEQEENKKEQLRTCKQNIVNNNIEIIKISEEKDVKPNGTIESLTCKDKKHVVIDQKNTSSTNSLSPKNSSTNQLAIPTPKSQKGDGFQRAFLESISSAPKLMNDTKKVIESKSKDGSEQKDIEFLKKIIEIHSSPKSDLKKNISITPPPASLKQANEKSSNKLSKSLTPPPMNQDSLIAANAALNLMLLNAAYPDFSQLQKSLMMETFRQNLALHQLQQQQQKVHNEQQKTNAQEQPTPSNFSQQNSDRKN